MFLGLRYRDCLIMQASLKAKVMKQTHFVQKYPSFSKIYFSLLLCVAEIKVYKPIVHKLNHDIYFKYTSTMKIYKLKTKASFHLGQGHIPLRVKLVN